MRIRKPAAIAVAALLTLAACGSDDGDDGAGAAPTAEDEMSADEMSDEMADDMSDDEMSDEMADDEMSDEMADDEMADDEMADDMSDDEMADDMSDDEMADDMSDDEMADDEMADDMSDDEMADDMSEMNDVMSLIIGRDDLTILDDAIHAVGLNDALHSEGPFTVFAPTDAAFDAYLGEMGMTVDDVLADEASLTDLIEAHVVEGTDDSAMVMDMAGQSFTTLGGTELAVEVDGDTVTVGGATVVEYDLTADNGVIHVIDAVLSPAG